MSSSHEPFHESASNLVQTVTLSDTCRSSVVPPAGFEPALPPPEGGALSPELRGPSAGNPSAPPRRDVAGTLGRGDHRSRVFLVSDRGPGVYGCSINHRGTQNDDHQPL